MSDSDRSCANLCADVLSTPIALAIVCLINIIIIKVMHKYRAREPKHHAQNCTNLCAYIIHAAHFTEKHQIVDRKQIEPGSHGRDDLFHESCKNHETKNQTILFTCHGEQQGQNETAIYNMR